MVRRMPDAPSERSAVLRIRYIDETTAAPDLAVTLADAALAELILRYGPNVPAERRAHDKLVSAARRLVRAYQGDAHAAELRTEAHELRAQALTLMAAAASRAT